jgi:hypothetical protein
MLSTCGIRGNQSSWLSLATSPLVLSTRLVATTSDDLVRRRGHRQRHDGDPSSAPRSCACHLRSARHQHRRENGRATSGIRRRDCRLSISCNWAAACPTSSSRKNNSRNATFANRVALTAFSGRFWLFNSPERLRFGAEALAARALGSVLDLHSGATHWSGTVGHVFRGAARFQRTCRPVLRETTPE